MSLALSPLGPSVKNWIKEILPIPIKEIDTHSFYKNFLMYLSTEAPVSIERFKLMQPEGSYFTNGVALVKESQPEVELRKYDESIVTPKIIIDSEYKKAVFKNEDGKYEICLPESTYNFLRVIAGDDTYNMNALRYFMRNVLVSEIEGRAFQSALYLYGAPGTSKSTFAELLKVLVPSERVQEFNRNQNNF